MSKPKNVGFLKGGKGEIPKWYGILKIFCADRKRFNSIGYFFFFQFGKGNVVVLVGCSFGIILNRLDR